MLGLTFKVFIKTVRELYNYFSWVGWYSLLSILVLIVISLTLFLIRGDSVLISFLQKGLFFDFISYLFFSLLPIFSLISGRWVYSTHAMDFSSVNKAFNTLGKPGVLDRDSLYWNNFKGGSFLFIYEYIRNRVVVCKNIFPILILICLFDLLFLLWFNGHVGSLNIVEMLFFNSYDYVTAFCMFLWYLFFSFLLFYGEGEAMMFD